METAVVLTPPSPAAMEISRRYGDYNAFCHTFMPHHQNVYCTDILRCITGTAPTLAMVAEAYPSRGNSAAAWLVVQLKDLSDFCGCRDKLGEGQYVDLSRRIVSKYSYLKVTELMLFLSWFKEGRYGHFYGSVDPVLLFCALGKFVGERNAILTRQEDQQRTRQRDEWRRRAVTYEEYLDIRRRAEMGDEDAIELLKPPREN